MGGGYTRIKKSILAVWAFGLFRVGYGLRIQLFKCLVKSILAVWAFGVVSCGLWFEDPVI